jgi:serine/threonine protein kinase
MDAINPDNLKKSMSILVADRAAIRNKAACHFPGIEDGIRHLHKRGLIHNDINPTNIMIDNGPVINDFDSSRAPGETLHKVKRTYGWHDPDVCVTREQRTQCSRRVTYLADQLITC